MQTQTILDPENYRRLAEPFASQKDADDALSAFLKELREIRQKHRIADVLTVVQVNVLNKDGEEGQMLAMGHNGMAANSESMAAFAYGQARAEREATISKMLANRGTK